LTGGSTDAKLSNSELIALKYLEREYQQKIVKTPRIKIAHKTPIRKTLFGTHIMATQQRSVCAFLAQNSLFFLQNHYYKLIFAILGNIDFLVLVVILLLDFTKFLAVFSLLCSFILCNN
jgi:hypothetical protein